MSEARKINAMYRLFGKKHGYICGECKNFKAFDYRSKRLQKCKCYGITHSEASDWARKWTACGLFDAEYKGRAVIETLTARAKPDEPIEGQITLEGINEEK